jgi:circadian clock protein KaiB
MTGTEPVDDSTLHDFERALNDLGSARYDLTLFVTGASALSARAISDVRALCDTYLRGRYQLQVVDIRRNPDLVTSRGVLASPTLIKDFPLPKRVLVGNLSNTNRMLLALDIAPVTPDPSIGVEIDPPRQLVAGMRSDSVQT